MSREAWFIHKYLGALENTASIHIYLIAANGVTYLENVNQKIIGDKNRGVNLKGLGLRSQRVCFLACGKQINPSYDPTPNNLGKIIGNTAHEMGHILIGPGHPDKYPHFKNILTIGPAPLPGTRHSDRLMFSGLEGNRDLERNLPEYGKLLVKAEWDAAENWMVSEELEGRITP